MLAILTQNMEEAIQILLRQAAKENAMCERAMVRWKESLDGDRYLPDSFILINTLSVTRIAPPLMEEHKSLLS